MKKRHIIGGICGLVLIGASLLLTSVVLHKNQVDKQTLVLSAISKFQPYQLKPDNMPEGVAIDTNGIVYANDVLIIPVKTINGQTVSISQQPTPEEFVGAQPTGKEKVDVTFGIGALSSLEDRNTINIITDDGVFILVNGPASVSTETLKTIARSLSH